MLKTNGMRSGKSLSLACVWVAQSESNMSWDLMLLPPLERC